MTNVLGAAQNEKVVLNRKWMFCLLQHLQIHNLYLANLEKDPFSGLRAMLNQKVK